MSSLRRHPLGWVIVVGLSSMALGVVGEQVRVSTVTEPTVTVSAVTVTTATSTTTVTPRQTPSPAPTVTVTEQVTATVTVPVEYAGSGMETDQDYSDDAAPQGDSGYAYYRNCSTARAAGAAPLFRGDPGYRSALDRDGDGIACE
ncbi:excalibur calcium-binding domain-containing protein [Propionibacterium australiense]|nr:excalibur calcium-binding domain-containing protein [Propionibacterium australiense]RLP08910.1 hypothetical protein D7U36_08865 [Propionibacterium australiense]RLP11713.1 hypothetical protein D9T14_03740 [Propionibacterium australiense]